MRKSFIFIIPTDDHKCVNVVKLSSDSKEHATQFIRGMIVHRKLFHTSVFSLDHSIVYELNENPFQFLIQIVVGESGIEWIRRSS